MAYNNYYPGGYNGAFYTPGPYQQTATPPPAQVYGQPSQTAYGQQTYGQPAPATQVQNGGYISAPSEEYVWSYPIAPGTTVAFKVEGLPYIYTKTMGFSPNEPPVIEKYKKEETNETRHETPPTEYALKSDFDELKSKLDNLYSEVNRRRYQDKKEKTNQ